MEDYIGKDSWQIYHDKIKLAEGIKWDDNLLSQYSRVFLVICDNNILTAKTSVTYDLICSKYISEMSPKTKYASVFNLAENSRISK